jgi:hypothetical protein
MLRRHLALAWLILAESRNSKKRNDISMWRGVSKYRKWRNGCMAA